MRKICGNDQDILRQSQVDRVEKLNFDFSPVGKNVKDGHEKEVFTIEGHDDKIIKAEKEESVPMKEPNEKP